ncbi:MAG: hypothetical protein V7642_757 [Burkholderiales bacterium]
MVHAPARFLSTDDMVEALTHVNSVLDTPECQQAFREALRALVCLAKAEKLLEIKRDAAMALNPTGIRPPAGQ